MFYCPNQSQSYHFDHLSFVTMITSPAFTVLPAVTEPAAIDCNLVSAITRSDVPVDPSTLTCFAGSVKCNCIIQGHLNRSAIYGSLDVAVAFEVDYFTKMFLHRLTILCFKTEACALMSSIAVCNWPPFTASLLPAAIVPSSTLVIFLSPALMPSLLP